MQRFPIRSTGGGWPSGAGATRPCDRATVGNWKGTRDFNLDSATRAPQAACIQGRVGARRQGSCGLDGSYLLSYFLCVCVGRAAICIHSNHLIQVPR